MTIDVTEVKRRLSLLLNNDANIVNQYIREYGPNIDMKNIKLLKEAKAKSVSAPTEEEGEDPVYEVKVKCPVCNRDEIDYYELRAKSQAMTQNKFLVPLYKGAFGFRTLDYNILTVCVCPRCLFASPDKKDFTRQVSGTKEITKSQIPTNIIMTMQEKIGERKALLKSVTDYEAFFKRPRSYESAIASYRLSMLRGNVEAWYEQPYCHYKLGAYALKIAKMTKDMEIDNKEVLREALGYFDEAFRTSNCAAEEIEMQVLYTIVALYLKLGDQKKANSFIAVFSNLKNARQAEMRENPKLTTTIIEKWEEKAKRLWEDRDDEDLFKEE